MSAPASKTAATVTGYSWIVFILPMLEETNLYNAISQGSARFTDTTGPFDPLIVLWQRDLSTRLVRFPAGADLPLVGRRWIHQLQFDDRLGPIGDAGRTGRHGIYQY